MRSFRGKAVEASSSMAGDAVDPADLARGSTDFRYLLMQNRVPDKSQVTFFKRG